MIGTALKRQVTLHPDRETIRQPYRVHRNTRNESFSQCLFVFWLVNLRLLSSERYFLIRLARVQMQMAVKHYYTNLTSIHSTTHETFNGPRFNELLARMWMVLLSDTLNRLLTEPYSYHCRTFLKSVYDRIYANIFFHL